MAMKANSIPNPEITRTIIELFFFSVASQWLYIWTWYSWMQQVVPHCRFHPHLFHLGLFPHRQVSVFVIPLFRYSCFIKWQWDPNNLMLWLCTESFFIGNNWIILCEMPVFLTEATITFLTQIVVNNTFEYTEGRKLYFPRKQNNPLLSRKNLLKWIGINRISQKSCCE